MELPLVVEWGDNSAPLDTGFLADLSQANLSLPLSLQLGQLAALPKSARLVTVQAYRQWAIAAGDSVHFTIRRQEGPVKIVQWGLWDEEMDPYFWGLTLVLFFFNWAWANVNLASMHSFYRDRLSKAYLFRTGAEDVEGADSQKLADLNAPASTGPYHLVNVALNLHGSKDAGVRGRNADFFIFSQAFCGSHRTGYCSTRDLEHLDRHLNLGTAMAISGAAAAPNMGVITVKPLVFIMTLLNIRLGYWLRNPKKVEAGSKKVQWRGPRSWYLMKEALGAVDAQGAFVNVSDGGHLENLGVYELLRRRCKFIVSVDGRADPDMECGSLVELIRFARIDMGVQIEMKGLKNLDKTVENKAVAKGRFSSKHWAWGEIDYGDGEPGYLLYIKSSLTSDENEYVTQYKKQNPAFPHESTGDQFFSETQFEVYRSLGFHAANRLLNADDRDLAGLIGEGEWDKLAENLAKWEKEPTG